MQHNYAEEEAARERYTNQRVKELMKEARLWRVANSAQWVAWGIVQAKVPELDDPPFSPSPDEFSPDLPTPASEASPSILSMSHATHEHDKRPVGYVAEALLSGANINEVAAVNEDDDEFDYLGYAQERAMFFWGDVVALGLVKREELPEGLRGRLKVVPY
jgi:choline kinase